jgi:Lon-like ATP-dependent protease
MHPALRSRIRGYGYEVFMKEHIEDTDGNRKKMVQFVAQEIVKDGKISHFTVEAVDEILREAKRKAGTRDKLTLSFRELGGLIRASGDIANEKKHKYVTADDVLEGKKSARTLEQQVGDVYLERKKEYNILITEGTKVGRVNGLAVMGDGGTVLPIVAEVAPAHSQKSGQIIATGKLGEIAKEAVINVSALIKKISGKDISNHDIHIQFLQTYEGVEGDSASVSVAVAVMSALEKVGVRQEVAMTGSLTVRGEVLPVGGVTQKIEAAIEAGLKKVIIPESNMKDVLLEKRYEGRIEVVPAKTIVDVLRNALVKGDALVGKTEKLVSG